MDLIRRRTTVGIHFFRHREDAGDDAVVAADAPDTPTREQSAPTRGRRRRSARRQAMLVVNAWPT
jgi:hypothetical protein